jgi:hypothetical protein
VCVWLVLELGVGRRSRICSRKTATSLGNDVGEEGTTGST